MEQMNEYRVMMFALGFLMLMVVLFNIASGSIAEDHALTRRVALANNIVRSALLFWPVIWTPLLRFLVKDWEYADMFTVGLAPTLTPAELR